MILLDADCYEMPIRSHCPAVNCIQQLPQEAAQYIQNPMFFEISLGIYEVGMLPVVVREPVRFLLYWANVIMNAGWQYDRSTGLFLALQRQVLDVPNVGDSRSIIGHCKTPSVLGDSHGMNCGVGSCK